MQRIAKFGICVALLATMFFPASFLEAQASKDSAPILAQILSANKISISNAGQGGLGGFSGEPQFRKDS
jgi:hypothetical protein